jgi:DNA-directed RNA polymerase subunit M/transcription elongation factor TFIIS
MPLPINLTTPTYEVKLPLSKKKVKYRPYLVKEEKLLMMAMESGDQKMIMKTVQDIIDECTFNEVKAKNLPTAELELLFLKLRAKSVGETSNIGYACTNCGTTNEISVNLEAIELDASNAVDPKIMLTDSVGVILKYPTAEDVTKVVASGESEITNTFKVIGSCIETIFDKENMYQAEDLSQEEIDEFVESLSSRQFEKIKEFFQGIPKLSKVIHFDCTKCGTHNELKLEGLQNFFA